jgi:hypothetical protein
MTSGVGPLLTNHAGNEVLETVWVNTLNISTANEPDDGWSGVRSGGDSFERVLSIPTPPGPADADAE